ncbi:KTSC domain-containing protein [Pedobacter sp. HMF7647]|uniref:KTSC domain-containing protein n=1 Tax=Hufsiella arboris TaxID=2695275 RepID=A0A7K1YFH4_9SPHI|nr:KTSC domain-containing protein [Hufsiella arboris]MXV53170.1 KTSC domain-containing protein [Hufsiella arboris]
MPSAVINEIVYDQQKELLRVVFVTGIIYEYQRVPEKVYKELKASLVKGRYLNHHVKGKYAFEKVG